MLKLNTKKYFRFLSFYSLILNQLLKLPGTPSNKSKIKGRHQFADLSINSTNFSPDIGLLKAVMKAHKKAHATNARIG